MALPIQHEEIRVKPEMPRSRYLIVILTLVSILSRFMLNRNIDMARLCTIHYHVYISNTPRLTLANRVKAASRHRRSPPVNSKIAMQSLLLEENVLATNTGEKAR